MFFRPLAALLVLLCLPGRSDPGTLSRPIDRVASLDPVHAISAAAARTVALVYETLLEYEYLERPYRLRGGVAEDLPERSPDGLTWTFRIRPGIFFGPDPCFGTDRHGKPARRELNAHDVVYSLKRLADARLSAPSYWILEGRILGLDAFRDASRLPGHTDYDRPVEGLQALDDRTVQLRLTGPSLQLLWGLAIPCTAIVPREAVEAWGTVPFGQREFGSGPYRLASWRRDYRMLFERRPGRDPERDETPLLADADGARPIERIRLVVMDDPSTRWLSFLTGALDLESDIPRDNWDAVLDASGALSPILAQRGIRIHSQPSLDCFYIGLNMDDPVVGTNRKLRQALNAAFDFETWSSLNRGRMEEASGPIPPNVAGRCENPFAYAFDLDHARRLLAEAGYPEGRDPTTGRRLVLQLSLGRTDQETRESTELLAAFLERIGIVLEARYQNWPAFLQSVGRREAQMFRVGWLADYPDAENFLQLFYSRNSSPGPNRSNYSHPRFDALYEQAARTIEEPERLELYRAMQQMVREDCPWIFLHHRRSAVLTQDRLRNFRVHDFPYGMEKHWRLTE